MARKTIFVSDLTGSEIEEQDAATVIRHVEFVSPSWLGLTVSTTGAPTVKVTSMPPKIS